MFKRRKKELTVEDAPDSIAPWEMLEEAEIEAQTVRLHVRWPGRNLIAFARRTDNDSVACFDKGPDGTGKAILVVADLDGADGATERHYPGFGAWFDTALSDAREYASE